MNYRDKVRQQLELEDEARALGSRRYHSRDLPWKPEAGSVEEEANLPPGRKLLKVALAPTAAGIEAFLKAAHSGKAGRLHSAAASLLLVDLMEAAYLTCRVLTNASVARQQMQRVAVQIAEALLDHVSMEAYREINRVGYKGFLRKQDARGFTRQRRAAVRKLLDSEGALIEITTNEKVTVGTKLIEIAIEQTGLWTVAQTPRSRGYAYTIAPSEALQVWLDKQHARCSILEPINMPMVVRPRRWRSPSYGGYLTPRPGNRFIKQRNKAYHEELRSVDLDPVYASVNHIQDTPWRVNKRILELMEKVWDEGGCLGGLPPRHDEPLPAKPHDIDENEEALKEWKRLAGETHTRNAQLVSGRVSLHQGLWVARRFQHEERIYYPHELDFRGRVYPLPVFGPSPQGSDWQKALIEFADGKPLGPNGKRWLYIHIANLFGVDKVSFDERVDWTLRHAPQLLDSAMNPLDGERFWTTADSPWSALAACMEFEGAMDLGEDFVSHLPIALDGSCSGLQHFSAMLRDEVGGSAVNLVPSDVPQDIYMRVAAVAQEEADASDEEFGKCWAGGKVTRAIAKRPTMTYCYSATRYGMQGMILDTLRGIDRDRTADGEEPYLGGVDNYQAAMWLSHVIYAAVGRVVRAAQEAMDWLRSVAEIASSDGLPLWWTTPMGLPILQEYRVQKGQVVKVHWAGQRVRLTINEETPALDRRAQANGVAPNFVHSLDAAHLQAVALRCRDEGIRHIAVIHDSFGTHAADTDRMNAILRETFIEQYSGNILQDFYQQLVEQLGEETAAKLPCPPKMGSLDLEVIRQATYSFA